MSTTASRLARFGLAAKGVLYALLAILAVRVAAGDRAEADSQGALRAIAGETFGSVILATLALGFAVYAAWQVYVSYNADELKTRLASAVRAIVWSSLAVSAARFLFQAGTPPKSEQSMTARVMNTGPGPWLIGIVGVAIVVFGVTYLRHIKDHRYLDDLKALPGRTRTLVKSITVTGIAAKATVYALVGGFLVRAAVRHKANSGVGLDGALSQIAKEPYGTYGLAAVATGLAAYAVWCWVRARYEDVARSDG